MKKERIFPTKQQLEIAKEFHIPISQAHTVNIQKAKEYRKYLQTQAVRDERFLEDNFIKKGAM
jgi:gamma-glutamylcysteine synthetase